MPSVKQCAICGGDLKPQRLGAYGTCLRCETVQLLNLPGTEINKAFAGSEAAEHMVAWDEARKGFLLKRLAMLEKPLSDITAPRLLDVGCSSGKLLSLASERGWSVTGIEMSAELAEVARQSNPQAHVLAGDILQLDLAHIRPFDAVVALDVIEHVLDPRAFLRRLNRLLVDGGQLLLQTPNTRSLRARLHGDRWNMLIEEYHFYLFSRKGLQQLLSSEGFIVESSTTVSGSGTESGIRAVGAAVIQGALAAVDLGNALLVKARKHRLT